MGTLPIYTVLNSAKHFPHTPYKYSAQLSQTFSPHSLYIQCSTQPNISPTLPIYTVLNSAKPFPPHSLYIQFSTQPNISPTLPIYTVLNSAKYFPHNPYIY